MSQNDPEEALDDSGLRTGTADSSLEWSVFPFAEDMRRSVVVVAVIAAAGALVYLAFKDVFLVLLSIAILVVSLHSFFARTVYRLDDGGVTVKTLAVRQFKRWSDLKRFYVDRKGVTLSPFSKPSRLEPFRSVRLLFGENRDEVVAFISEKLGGHS
jgi:hypothetical protein